MDSWKKECRESQQMFADKLGDRVWDKFPKPVNEDLLWEKIAFAQFGPSEKDNVKDGYSGEAKEKVDELVEKCLEYSIKKESSDGVYLAFIFINVYQSSSKKGTLPVIRLKKGSGEEVVNSYFIDHCGRVYKNWADFLEDNIFDGFWLCVPKNATYSFNDEVNLEFIDQTERGKVLEVVDTVATVSSITTSVTGVVGVALSFFPPTAVVGIPLAVASSIVGAPGAIYGTGRSIGKLVDRGTHDQSISLADREARACWINAIASALALGTLASAKLLTSAAKLGSVASPATRILCTTLNVTCVSVSGAGVINSIADLVTRKEKVTALDILQLSTSIFFFTHSAINFRTASGIIKDAQKATIAAQRSRIAPEHHEKFDAMMGAKQANVEPGRIRTMHGNAEFIRELRLIGNKNEFFSAFQMQQNQFNIHNELVIDPKAFFQMTADERNLILQKSKQFSANEITAKEFNKAMSSVKKNYRVTFERQFTEARENIQKKFNVGNFEDIAIGNNRILNDAQRHEVKRMDVVVRNTMENSDNAVKASMKMAEKMNCKTVSEYTAVAEYMTTEINKMVKEELKHNSGSQSKKTVFNNICKEFSENDIFQADMIKKFTDLMEQCGGENAKGNPQFGNSFAAAYHYNKHPSLPKVDSNNNLTPNRYFEIAREMTAGKPKSVIWTQNGKSLCCKFESAKYGAVAIRYDNLADGKSVIATLMHDDRIIDSRLYES